VHGLAQVDTEALSRPTPLAVKGNGGNGTSHDRDGDAGTETVCRRQYGVFACEGHHSPGFGSGQPNVGQQTVEGSQRIEFTMARRRRRGGEVVWRGHLVNLRWCS
jgi:hypothetical protein